jgi:hypothetical protein
MGNVDGIPCATPALAPIYLALMLPPRLPLTDPKAPLRSFETCLVSYRAYTSSLVYSSSIGLPAVFQPSGGSRQPDFHWRLFAPIMR